MAFCPNCGNSVPEDGTFCANCGTPVTAQRANPQPVQPPVQPVQPPVQPPMQPMQPMPMYANPNDHTAEFDAEDISSNKVVAMASYMLGTLGIIIALLAAPQSPYAGFHSRQALKIDILTILVAIATLVLVWTVIVPFVGGICMVILVVVRIICFFQVCSGKAKDAPIVGSIPFLK